MDDFYVPWDGGERYVKRLETRIAELEELEWRVPQWRSTREILPNDGEKVLALYPGVYGPEVVVFFTDREGQPHFGGGPATYWMPLPRMPEYFSGKLRE